MSSRTAEAVFITLCNGLQYLFDYFSYSGNEAMLNKMNIKCITTWLVECVFGHATQECQANNLIFMKMSRCITNDALLFCYHL